MNTHVKHRRLAAVAAGLALATSPLAVGAVTGPAGAAPASRSASTSVDTTYLSDTLGLPTSTIVETVTYDRFQWLLQQPGQFAFLVGSTNDANFKANAVAADAAARAAGAQRIYWFDPNLSGQVDVPAAGNVAAKPYNLDTRKPGGISTIAAASQTTYGNVWNNVVAQYLGNGIKATVGGAGVNSENAIVTTAADDTVVNDAVDPIWDYRSTATQAAVGASEDVFFVYDKDHTSGAAADKVVDWTDLSAAASTTAVGADVTAALASARGGAVIDQLDQFAFWKSEVNAKHQAQNPDAVRWGSTILDDSDAADGWHIDQITYPELLHLLNISDSADKNFVILFGGTWCPNTRAILKDLNKEAQDNDVTVYNFDTVLDGGTVGGGTTSSADPLQIRNTVNSGATANANPTFLYANVLTTYLKNIVTQYDNGTYVTYNPNGDPSKGVSAVRKLQVPFLINYQRGSGGSPSTTAIKRQWLQQNTDPSTGLPSFKEYMTNSWFTHPAGTNLGLSPTYTSPSSPGYPTELGFPADAAAALSAPDSAYLTATERASTTLTADDKATIVGARRSSVSGALASVAFADEAKGKLTTFFGGLPGGVVSQQSVTTPAAAYGSPAKVNLAIENKYGRVPSGKATLQVAGRTLTQTVAQNAASFTVTGLVPGSYPYTVSYTGDAQILGFAKTGTLVVGKGKVTRTAGAVVKVPTSKKSGSYKVTVTSPSGLVAAGGKVTVTLAKGATRKSVTGTLKAGSASVRLPKLAKGTWTVKVAYAGDAHYLALTGTGTAVKVKK